MSIDQNKEIVRQFFANAASGARDDELFDEQIAYHGPPMIGEFRGRDAFKQVLAGFRSAFPGFETTIEELIAEGDLVTARHTHSGTHAGEFVGLPPTGKHIRVGGIEIFRVKDGRIAEFWHLDDFLSLMQQLGAVPAG